MGIDFTEPTTPGTKRDQATVKLLAYYVKRIAEEEGTSEKKRLEYVPEYILGSLRNKWAVAMDDDPAMRNHFEMTEYEKEREEVCTKLSVDEEAFRFLTQLVFSAVGGRQVLPVWPQVLLYDQPPSKHPVKSIHIVLLTEWEDGRLLPMSNLVHAELATIAGGLCDGQGMSNAVTAAHILKTMKTWVEDVTEKGTDTWYGLASDHGGDNPFNVLMGMMLYIITANKAVRDGKQLDLVKFAATSGMRLETLQQLRVVPPLDPKVVDNMENWMRLCQAMVRPPMPPEVRKILEQRRNERAAMKASKQAPGKLLYGGWDG